MSNDTFGGEQSIPRRPILLVTLAVVLFFEALLMALLAGFLVFELFSEVSTSLGSAVAIIVFVVISSVWLFVVGIGALHARPWVRAAAFTWQILQLAVAVGSFQGIFAREDIGWFLLIPAVLVIFLLFTKSVMAATKRA